MSKVKYVRTAVVLVQLAEDDPIGQHSRILRVNDREVFRALYRFTTLRQLEFNAATRSYLKKARTQGRRLNLGEPLPGHLLSADCAND
jgi:hypothetical protein